MLVLELPAYLVIRAPVHSLSAQQFVQVFNCCEIANNRAAM